MYYPDIYTYYFTLNYFNSHFFESLSFEIICINDGSIDNTLNIIKKYAMNDNRIQIISQINRRLSEDRNTGVKYSNGEYIYLINDDDYLELNALSDLYYKAKKIIWTFFYLKGIFFQINQK